MAFTKNTDDLNIIQALPDEPNDVGGLTASQLKAKFDEAGGKLKTSLNGLVDELGATTAAANIGFASTTGVQEDNVQDAIENVQGQLAEISQGAVADGSITTAKLADGAVTAEKLASGGIGWRKLTASEFGLTANTGVKTIEDSAAYYCAALGIVRFQARITVVARTASSAIYDLYFDSTKYYKPTPGDDFYLNGVVNAKCYAKRVSGNLEGAVAVRAMVFEDVAEDSLISVSGFYYTEDVPSGGES